MTPAPLDETLDDLPDTVNAAALRRMDRVASLFDDGVTLPAVGSVPLLGDLFDVVWKANRRNLNLVRRDLGLDE